MVDCKQLSISEWIIWLCQTKYGHLSIKSKINEFLFFIFRVQDFKAEYGSMHCKCVVTGWHGEHERRHNVE